VLHAQFPIDDLGYVGDGDVEYHEAHMSRHSNSFLVHACASYEIVPEVCLCPRYLVLRKLWRLVGVHWRLGVKRRKTLVTMVFCRGLFRPSKHGGANDEAMTSSTITL
jgi:hypothetical protein